MRKKLGQHFLKEQKALRKIVRALEITPRDTIVEIGPGHGELTKHILSAKPRKIIAIERDPRLVDFLEENFHFTILNFQSGTKLQLPKRGVIEGDALKVLPDFVWKLKNGNWKLVGNIPYYITGYLLRKIGELERKPKLIVFTIQKEVSERIVARPPHMNLLAASVQFWGKPKIVSYVSKKSFRPPPKVDSAIIKITPSPETSGRWFEGMGAGGIRSREKYYEFIKILFKQPRKMVLNNLREEFKLPQKEIENRLQKLNISPQLRPANLSMLDINKLTLIFHDKRV